MIYLEPPPSVDVHVRLSPVLLVQLLKRSVAVPCKHTQVANTLSMHVSEQSQPAVPGDKIANGESELVCTSTDSW